MANIPAPHERWIDRWHQQNNTGEHVEAKESSGATFSETVSWSKSFSSTPVVVTSTTPASSGTLLVSVVTSRSTTGAEAQTYRVDGTDNGTSYNTNSTFIAMEST